MICKQFALKNKILQEMPDWLMYSKDIILQEIKNGITQSYFDPEVVKSSNPLKDIKRWLPFV